MDRRRMCDRCNTEYNNQDQCLCDSDARQPVRGVDLLHRLKEASKIKDCVVTEIEEICQEILVEGQFDDVQGVWPDESEQLLIVYVLGDAEDVRTEDLRWIGRRTGFRKVMARGGDRTQTDIVSV